MKHLQEEKLQEKHKRKLQRVRKWCKHHFPHNYTTYVITEEFVIFSVFNGLFFQEFRFTNYEFIHLSTFDLINEIQLQERKL